jgi:hypothetical protein
MRASDDGRHPIKVYHNDRENQSPWRINALVGGTVRVGVDQASRGLAFIEGVCRGQTQ